MKLLSRTSRKLSLKGGGESSDEEGCCICLDDSSTSFNKLKKLSCCLTMVHANCLEKWTDTQRTEGKIVFTCPICKTKNPQTFDFVKKLKTRKRDRSPSPSKHKKTSSSPERGDLEESVNSSPRTKGSSFSSRRTISSLDASSSKRRGSELFIDLTQSPTASPGSSSSSRQIPSPPRQRKSNVTRIDIDLTSSPTTPQRQFVSSSSSSSETLENRTFIIKTPKIKPTTSSSQFPSSSSETLGNRTFVYKTPKPKPSSQSFCILKRVIVVSGQESVEKLSYRV